MVRNVALRIEEGRGRGKERQLPEAFDPDGFAADDPSLSRAFDRAWATALVREAALRQAEDARDRGPEASRRVELLNLRFQEGMPIRDIARHWQVDPARLHHEYATARREFLAALREVIAFHQPGTPGEVERACVDLLKLLS